MDGPSLRLILPNAACLLVLAALAAWTLSSVARHDAQIESLHDHVESVLTLADASGEYATQLAQSLLLGREQQSELHGARLEMERSFVRLLQSARGQAVEASNAPATQEAIRSVETARRMLDLYHSIDRSAARAMVLARDLRPAEAQQTYDREVNFRLTTEFAALLDDVRQNVQSRLAAAQHADDEARNLLANLWLAALAGCAGVQGYTFLALSRRPSLLPGGLAAAFEARAEELRASNRRLRDIDAKRAQFLADVSHELRTPLTILRGEADVALLPSAGTAEHRRALERIQAQAAELGDLLDDLIAFARSDAEQQALQLAPVLLDDLLAAAVQEGETLAEPREVTLTLALPGKPAWIMGDSRRLKQALLIGIDNAINHSPPGTQIQLARVTQDNQVSMSIADQGTGFDASDQARVFDRFYRGSRPNTSFGLGIGLAIARAVVEQHQGTIELHNRSEGGAELTITLPLLREPLL